MSIRSYFLEDDFKMIYLPNQIDITNYQEIESFEETKIKIASKEGEVVITGKDLSICKLLEEEVLIRGQVEKIEFR